MNKNVENLIRKAIHNSDIELASNILDLEEPKYSKLWAEVEHRCPLCNKPQFTLMDVDFTESVGMCINCDHILPDGWYDVRGEQ